MRVLRAHLEVTAQRFQERPGQEVTGQEVFEGSIPSEEGRFKETEEGDHVTFSENCQGP